jgi:hypothetical protein
VSRSVSCLAVLLGAWSPGEPAAGGAEPAVRGPVSGQVIALDAERGIMVLQTAEGDLELCASPPELQGLRRGDEYSGEVEMFGDRPWLVEQPEATAAVDRTALDRSRGMVAALDHAGGALVLWDPSRARRSFRAHPRLLSAVVPGSEVEVHHHQVGAARWVHLVDPAPGPEIASGRSRRAG